MNNTNQLVGWDLVQNLLISTSMDITRKIHAFQRPRAIPSHTTITDTTHYIISFDR